MEKEFCFEFMVLSHLIKRYLNNQGLSNYVDNLSGTNGWVIGYLMENRDRDIFQKDIENAFSIRKSTVSKILRLMEQKQLIRRVSVSSDARLKKLELTDKAYELHKFVMENIMTLNEKFTENLTDEEIEQFISIIKKVKKSFESEIQ
jgi:DNA-binding MarR family transcriptional regulator